MLFGLSIRNRTTFVPFLSETLPALAQARNRRSGLPSAAMLVDPSPFSTSIGVHGPSLSRYESFAWIGLARTQSSYSPADGALNRYDASPGLVVEVADEVAAGELVALDLVVPVRVPVHRRLRRLLALDPDPRRPRRLGEGQYGQNGEARRSGNRNEAALDLILNLDSTGISPMSPPSVDLLNPPTAGTRVNRSAHTCDGAKNTL